MLQIKRQNNRTTAIKAGLAGAVIGATGAAIGMAMSDKKNRDKVKKSLDDAQKWTKGKIDDMKTSSQEAQNDIQSEAKKIKKQTEEKAQ